MCNSSQIHGRRALHVPHLYRNGASAQGVRSEPRIVPQLDGVQSAPCVPNHEVYW